MSLMLERLNKDVFIKITNQLDGETLWVLKQCCKQLSAWVENECSQRAKRLFNIENYSEASKTTVSLFFPRASRNCLDKPKEHCNWILGDKQPRRLYQQKNFDHGENSCWELTVSLKRALAFSCTNGTFFMPFNDQWIKQSHSADKNEKPAENPFYLAN